MLAAVFLWWFERGKKLGKVETITGEEEGAVRKSKALLRRATRRENGKRLKVTRPCFRIQQWILVQRKRLCYSQITPSERCWNSNKHSLTSHLLWRRRFNYPRSHHECVNSSELCFKARKSKAAERSLNRVCTIFHCDSCEKLKLELPF